MSKRLPDWPFNENMTKIITRDSTNYVLKEDKNDPDTEVTKREVWRPPDRDPYCVECGWVEKMHVEDTTCGDFQQRISRNNRRAAVEATREKNEG